MERAGKKYREKAQLIDKNRSYSVAEAIELVAKTSSVKFDAAVEMHINLNADPTQADQNIRGSVVLPAGMGKVVKVAVLAEDTIAEQAKKAGADEVGMDQILAQLDKEQIGFDILITTPQVMPTLSKYARFLGPRGLMPNPKSGTVTNDIAKAVTEAKTGKVEFRMDSAGIIHLAVGRASFDGQKLTDNAETILSAIRSAKPSSIKGTYIKSIYLSSSMGPSIKVDSGR